MVKYPADWKECKIGDFLRIQRGASPRPIEDYLTLATQSVNWIKIGDAPKAGKYIVSTEERITWEGARHSVYVKQGEFILSNSMSFGRPYILKTNGCIHDGWLRLYDFQNEVHSNFLYYVLSSRTVKEQYVAFAAGSGVQNLNKKIVQDVEVILPPLEEQKAIADALTAFDTYIDDLTALIQKKKDIRDGALEDLVSGRTRLNGRKVPWEKVALNDIAYYGNTRKVVIRQNYISTENMKSNFMGIEKYKGDDLVSGLEFEESDILMANIRPYLKKIWFSSFSGGCSPDVLVIKADKCTIPKFLYYALANDRFINFVMNGGVKGLKMPRGDKKIIMKYELLLPVDRTEQQAIADTLTAMDEEIRQLEAKRDKMKDIRDGAMDDLLTGRIRLGQ